MSWRLLALASLTALVACNTTPKPPRTHEDRERKFDGGSQFLSPVKITPQTIVLDARSRFEYSTAHMPHSMNVQWRDFTEPQRPGALLEDREEMARRFARYGITLTSPVVIVGEGFNGDDEEGRIAWTLSLLGVKQVQFTTLTSLKARMSNSSDEVPGASAEYWKPAPIESLNVPREEFKFALDERGNEKPVSYEGAPPIAYRFLDVRSRKDDYTRPGLNTQSGIPRGKAVAIPWREFFDDRLRVLPDSANRLKAAGFTPEMRVIVLSEDGVSSAGVTLALRALGYSHAGNLAEGVHDLFPGQ